MEEAHARLSFGSRLSAGLRRHGVALISLCVALFGTSYNTWRNQTTEFHRNVRSAGFMVLDQLGQLQELADRRLYAGDRTDANRIAGWGKVSAIRDMAKLVSPAAEVQATTLFAEWQADVDKLDSNDEAAEQAEAAVSASIVALRTQVLQELKALN